MDLKAPLSFSIFAPKSPTARPATEVRFSRWNNANAQKFVRPQREQKEIEDEIRRERRFESATKIAENYNSTTNGDEEKHIPKFKSIGTPSSPSRPSIPGKASKYSKNPQNPNLSHPAFRSPRVRVSTKIPIKESDVSIGDNGVFYRVPNAPFEFQYSYTETPKVKPLALREPPMVPFGPTTMPRPWTGRKPLPASKKKLPEFDSFKLPPPHKKGVKSVQAPGPFLAGSGPKHVMSREEILGEPLTKEETKALIEGCLRTRRQLNMGRDGLTHNMLDNIHSLWKRRRVCKIKCKGVCTVNMDNVRQQLEEKTGGKIIYSKGGVIFLFRGRNYNYKTRPRFPLMLWRPVTPVYPRLIPWAPAGLTLDEANDMRKRGRNLPPICKLGKNGVYSDLVTNVKEAFEECELARINCTGMNSSDYKKIGAKLKDLVPCVLISFEFEHILMWRGRDWKSSLPKLGNDNKESVESITNSTTANSPECVLGSSVFLGHNLSLEETKVLPQPERTDQLSASTHVSATLDSTSSTDGSITMSEGGFVALPESRVPQEELGATSEEWESLDELAPVAENSQSQSKSQSSQTCTEGVLLLLRQAIESGSALVLDDDSLDANVVYQRAVALAKTASPGPVFTQRIRKVVLQKVQKQDDEDLEVKEFVGLTEKRGSERKSPRDQRRKGFKDACLDIVPHGSLRVDELAKLLA
ncbi:RNA-binding CRS1 / YhbY (CRM) domain-containing protein [Tasmannia lanceolata]|uniref:RNA-binding CRS1 / YhbY (CRM) domain-containing protein n=1 Tax=Tasmannia lanceolata TaxID=3420 RepID=UPI0040644AD3